MTKGIGDDSQIIDSEGGGATFDLEENNLTKALQKIEVIIQSGSREEMSNAKDLGKFFQIKLDKRDLNYANYNFSANKKTNLNEDFTSHNTDQLDSNNLIKFLKEQDFIKKGL